MRDADHRAMHSRNIDGVVIRPLRGSLDARHHLLVAYLPGDPRPAGIARLVRHGDAAEVSFEADDERICAALAEALAADARAAGISDLDTTGVAGNPRRALATWLGVGRRVVAALD